MKIFATCGLLIMTAALVMLFTVSCKENGKAKSGIGVVAAAKPAVSIGAEEEEFQDLQEPQIILPSLDKRGPQNGRNRSLRDIRQSGILRVLTIRDPELPRLQRSESVQERELALLTSLADWLDVKIQLIYTETYDQLIPALLAGEGDVIAANMTATEERKRQVAFSVPIDEVREQLIASAKSKVRNLNDLGGKTIVVERGTSYWQNVNDLNKRYPGIKLLSSETDTEALIGQVGTGDIEFTVADDNYMESYFNYRKDIKTIYTFPEKRFVCWAMDRRSEPLRQAINTFLKKELPFYRDKSCKLDFPQIERRRILRVITRDNPVNYFIHRGRMMGFEYELAKKFADEHRLHLVMITPPHQKYMIPWLISGKGDIIASTMTVTDQRLAEPGTVFCEPYLNVNEVVVTRKNDNSIRDPRDLANRVFAVRADSSYYETLQLMKNNGLQFRIKIVADDVSSFEILQGVAEGKYDITLVDDVFFKAKLQGGDNLKSVYIAGKQKQYSWMVRDSSPELREEVDKFIRRNQKSTFFNLLYRKYFTTAKDVTQYWDSGKNRRFQISPYDTLIKKYAVLNDFDWCLISAQIFQESGFNPLIVASDGGLGLMQLMPATAARFHCKDPLEPESNVKAGTFYMRKLRNIFDESIPLEERTCFALASYNGGYGHVYDARLLAASLGLNPDVWKDNVEVAIMKLSTAEYSSKARFGFCRADIITNYVKRIMLQYYHYRQMTDEKTASQKTDK